MAEAKDDPYGWLIKLCQPTSSQELKLQTCSFAGEPDFPSDCFDSMATSAPGTSPLDTMRIVISSPPETDSQKSSSIDKGDTQENDNFLTPPESHIPSSSSSQEDRQRLKPATLGDAIGSDSVVAETMFDPDDGRVANKVSINLGEGDRNLGFSDTGKTVSHAEDSDGQHLDSANDVGEIGRFQGELKRFSTSNSELDEPMSKKIRVTEQSMDSEINDKMNDDKIIDLDAEEIDEEIHFDKGKSVDVHTLGEKDAFNGNGDGKGVDNSPKEGVGRDSQNLPPSIRGNEEDKQVGEDSRYVKVKKASWTEIVNALEVIFGKEDDGSEDIDLLEAVKRRGITFPKPRWL